MIALALGLIFVVTLPQLLARHAEIQERADVDRVPGDLRDISAEAPSTGTRSTAPLLPRASAMPAQRAEPLASARASASAHAAPERQGAAPDENAAGADHAAAPRLRVLRGGAQEERERVRELLSPAARAAGEDAAGLAHRQVLPLAAGEAHPVTHIVNATERTAMPSSQHSTPAGRRLSPAPRLPRNAAGDRRAPRQTGTPASARSAGAAPRRPARDHVAQRPVRGQAARPAAAPVPARRRSPLLPVLGMTVLLGVPVVLVLAVLAAFSVVGWEVPAAAALVTVLALFGVRMLNTRRSAPADGAAGQSATGKSAAASRAEDTAHTATEQNRAPRESRSSGGAGTGTGAATPAKAASKRTAGDRLAQARRARQTGTGDARTASPATATGSTQNHADRAQEAVVLDRDALRKAVRSASRRTPAAGTTPASPGTSSSRFSSETLTDVVPTLDGEHEDRRVSARHEDRTTTARDGAAQGRTGATPGGTRGGQGDDVPEPAEAVSFDELLQEDQGGRDATGTWTPRRLPAPTYVGAPAAPAGERGAADAGLAEALAMEFASQPGHRPEVDPLLAHGRTATKPGRGNPQEAHVNKAVKSAQDLDSVLQRRRA